MDVRGAVMSAYAASLASNHDLISSIQGIVSIVFACVGTVGVWIAVKNYNATRRDQRDSSVSRAYSDYLAAAAEKPEFAFPPYLDFDLKNEKIDGDAKKFEEYEWFLTILLTTLLYISRAECKRDFSPKKPGKFWRKAEAKNGFWKETMILQLSYHWRYLKYFRDNGRKAYLNLWDAEIQGLIDDGIKKGESDFNQPEKVRLKSGSSRAARPEDDWDETV
jgi:hypothetical protein